MVFVQKNKDVIYHPAFIGREDVSDGSVRVHVKDDQTKLCPTDLPLSWTASKKNIRIFWRETEEHAGNSKKKMYVFSVSRLSYDQEVHTMISESKNKDICVHTQLLWTKSWLNWD